ncbi:polymorphic toxin type 25 domain-containing protein [Yersinia rohdei]|uniref:polymorphic toxin type 25 domain-containing protein n=1 Tax=Yersinia rohdei TaxID=29485 RepID=UPI001186E1EF|nr:polymorphic toxin type 25 domain-containing protein [Yersinia rohdei]
MNISCRWTHLRADRDSVWTIFPWDYDSERNSSVGLGLGVISSEISYGKDGFGFSFGAGPAWGWSGVSTNAAGEKNGYQWFLWN